jgi:hypothetical protein
LPPEGFNRRTFLCVDHDHKTGAIRGLLCNNCNASLGYLHDDPVQVRAALTYLESPLAFSASTTGIPPYTGPAAAPVGAGTR